nr:MAG TPA: Adenosylhomocysteinase [Caudoviricetes sp.]
MANINDFLTGIRRIDETCFETFAPFYEARSKHYLYPVFYQSITQMIAAGGFFYAIHRYGSDKVLAIYKRSSIMGNWSVILHIAPISITGSRENEVRLIQACRRCGISAKLSDEDIKRYKVPLSICTPISGNCEFLYDAGIGYKMQGAQFRKLRNRVKQITKRADFHIETGMSADITSLVAKWDSHNHATKEKTERTTQSLNIKRIAGLKTERMHILRVYIGESLEIFSVLEKLTEKCWCIVFEMRNYNGVLKDVTPSIHYYNCKRALSSNRSGQRTLLNKGASLNIAGMHRAKERLRPVHRQQIYKIAPINRMNAVELKKIFR